MAEPGTKIIASERWKWLRVGVSNPRCRRVAALAPGDHDACVPDAHTDFAVLMSDPAITLAWGMTGGAYHEPWATTRCPNRSAWTGFFDIGYDGTLLHRNVFVSVDEDRCYLPLPRNLYDLRVAADYAQLTALLSTLSLDSVASEFCVYLRRARLVLVDMPWPLR